MKGRIGDNAVTVGCDQWEDLGIIDIVTPTLDQTPIFDVVPSGPTHFDGQLLEELEELVGVVLVEGANQDSPAVAKDDFLGESIRHRSAPCFEKR
jgi:hypothetical protein